MKENAMVVVTTRDQIRSTARRFLGAYRIAIEDRESAMSARWRHEPFHVTYEKLLKLNLETCTHDDVKAIIGNGSWSQTPTCHACGNEDNGPRLVLNPDASYEEAHFNLCPACLITAVRFMGDALPEFIVLSDALLEKR